MRRSPKLGQLPAEVQEAIASGRWTVFAMGTDNVFAIKSDVGSWFIIDGDGVLLETVNSKPEQLGNPILMPFGSIQKFINRTASNT